MSSQPTLFDSPASALQREIAAEAARPWSRYRSPDDITAGRHGGAETSEDAHEVIRAGKEAMRLAILAFLREQGAHGATTYECALHFGKPSNAVSGRMTEIIRDGRAVKTMTRRPTSGACTGFVILAREGE